jgi:hypothetical protein
MELEPVFRRIVMIQEPELSRISGSVSPAAL